MSFLVRLWREEAGDASEPAGTWESQVEHIQTGRRWSFSTLPELLEFLGRQTADADGQKTVD